MRLRDLSRQSTTPSAQRHISGQPGWAEHSSDGRSAAPKLVGKNRNRFKMGKKRRIRKQTNHAAMRKITTLEIKEKMAGAIQPKRAANDLFKR